MKKLIKVFSDEITVIGRSFTATLFRQNLYIRAAKKKFTASMGCNFKKEEGSKTESRAITHTVMVVIIILVTVENINGLSEFTKYSDLLVSMHNGVFFPRNCLYSAVRYAKYFLV